MKTILATLLTVLCTWVFPHALHAQNSAGNIVLMSIQGPDGLIEGEVTQAGREKLHRLQAYSHEIVSPRDAASGLPTGKRQHKPFSVVKYINKGTPSLLNAMVRGELLTVDITLWAVSQQSGQEVKVATYRLSGASVVSIRPWMPNRQDAAVINYTAAEEISFAYRTISVTWENGAITAEDEWEGGRDAAKKAATKP